MRASNLSNWAPLPVLVPGCYDLLVALGSGNEVALVAGDEREQLVGRKPAVHDEDQFEVWCNLRYGREQFF